MAETHYCKSRWMQEHPWLDRLYVKLALQVKKRTKNKKVSNTWTQNEEKKPKSIKAGRADTSNPLWWVGMQMDYEIIKKLNLRAGFYSSLWQAKAKRKTEGAELLNTQPHQLVKVTVCNHTVAGVFKLPFFFFSRMCMAEVYGCRCPVWVTLHRHSCRRSRAQPLPKLGISDVGTMMSPSTSAHQLSDPGQILQTPTKSCFYRVLGQALTCVLQLRL